MDKWLEPAAVATGLITVWLSTQQKISAWPVALVNAALYFAVFLRDGLYANMGLQVVFFALSCYGWYEWKFGGAGRTELPVTRVSRRLAPRLVLAGSLMTLALGLLLGWVAGHDASTTRTARAVIWLDAATTSTSLVAQWMLTRKLLENWIVWVVVDVVYVGLFLATGLLPTAGLYVVFTGLATSGYLQWKRTLRA